MQNSKWLGDHITNEHQEVFSMGDIKETAHLKWRWEYHIVLWIYF